MELLGPGQLDPQGGGGGGMLGPSERTWVGVGTKLLEALGPLDGFYEGLTIEAFRV